MVAEWIEDIIDLLKRTPDVPEGGAKLLTIGVSHFCEKARWALDLSPLREKYIEDAHPPILHITPAMRVTKNAKKTGTPILVFSDGRYVADSTDILVRLSERFPSDMSFLVPGGLKEKVLELEAEFGSNLGVSSRRVSYHYFLIDAQSTEKVVPYIGRHAPTVERYFARKLVSRLGPVMMTHMGVTEETHAESVQYIRDLYKRISAMLDAAAAARPGKKAYILGTDRLSAADLTFAALSYPLIAPPETADLLPPLEERHPEFQRLTEELRATSAGQHVLRLYREERYPGKVGAPVTLRTPNRDRVPWLLIVLSGATLAGVVIAAVRYSRRK